MKRAIHGLFILLSFYIFSACGGSSALKDVEKDLAKYPEYSIILQDMKIEGNFFKEYYQRYKIVYADQVAGQDSLSYFTSTTDWLRVSEKEYRRHEPFLGMVLAAKTRDGNVIDTEQPPGYQYVGNPRYGHWRSDSHGNSFWAFYGKYALLSQAFGMFSRPVYRNDWNDYRRYRERGEPYFGKNREYGTYGSRTKKTNPTFFQRRQAREQARKQSFMNKVKQRTRRSNMSGTRSRSRGFGK